MQAAVLDPICALAPAVVAAADQIERERALPPSLVADLKAAGAFRALIPADFGGLAAPFDAYLRTVETLAAADASTAWCVNQAAVIGITSLWLPADIIAEIWAEADTSVANGPPFDCVIEPEAGGYRLTGHWGFSSGCQHATRMMGAARCSTGGYRIAYFTPGDVTFHDNWQVAGLRGTGSFEFRVTDLPVGEAFVGDMADAPTVNCVMTRIPNSLAFAVSFAAVALGVARGSLEDALDIARDKTPRFVSRPLRDDPNVQHGFGQTEARLRAARAYLFDTVDSVVASLTSGSTITHDERAALRMAGTHVIRECAEVVDAAYRIAGSTGIYQTASLQRRFQDMHVITQHVQARESYFAALGRYQLSGTYELGPMM